MSHLLPKGLEIKCPRKRHLIGVLNRDIDSAAPLNVTSISFEPEQERIAGDLGKCKLCGSLYFLQGSLYTQDGWQPKPPQLEPVTRK